MLLKISRLEGLIEGVFAIAMTILVLDFRIGTGVAEQSLKHILLSDILYKLTIYVGSFIILGTLWIAINFQQGILDKLNRPYLWTNVFYLMTICIVPFSASLVANFPDNQASLSFFAINLLFASFGQFLTTETARHYKLYKWFYNDDIRNAVLRRIFLAPIFYIAALIVAFWSPHLAFLILVMPILIYIKPGRVDKYADIGEEET